MLRYLKNTEQVREKLEKAGIVKSSTFKIEHPTIFMDDYDFKHKLYNSTDSEHYFVDEFIDKFCKPTLKEQLEKMKSLSKTYEECYGCGPQGTDLIKHINKMNWEELDK